MSRGPAPEGSSLSDYTGNNKNRKPPPRKKKATQQPSAQSLTSFENWLRRNNLLSQDAKDQMLSIARNISPAEAHTRLTGKPPASGPSSPQQSAQQQQTTQAAGATTPSWQGTGGAASPQLGGTPNITGVEQYINPRTKQIYPGTTPSTVSQAAQYKLLTGGDVSPYEVSALEQSKQLGFQPGESDKDKAANLWANTGVYTGETEAIPQPKGENAERIAGKQKQTTRPKIPKTVQQLEHDLYGLPSDQVKALQKKLLDAGYAPQGFKASGIIDQDTIQAYDNLLKETAAYQNEPKSELKQITPNELLDRKIAGIKAAGGNNSQKQTTTTTSINLTDPITAKGYLVGSMKSLLGRMPTAGEINQFVSSLNAFESANPQVTTQTTSSSGTESDQNNTVNTFSQGGPPSGDAFAESYLLSQNPQEVKTNRALGFYQAALDALKSPVSV